MSSLKRLNKLPSARAFSAAEKWKPATRKTLESLSKDRFRKERDKYKVSLMNGSSFISPRIQRKVVLLALRTVVAVGF